MPRHKKLKQEDEPKPPMANNEIFAIWEDAIIHEKDSNLTAQISRQAGKRVIAEVTFDLKGMKDKYSYEYEALTNNVIDSLDTIKDILLKKENGYGFQDVLFTMDNFNTESTIKKKKIRELRAEDIGKLVLFDGLVKNSTGVIPKMELVAMECNNDICGGTITYVRQEGDMECTSYTKCVGCGESSNEMIRREDKSIFLNFMKCEVEEDPEGLRGRQPERIPCEIEGELTSEEKRIGVGNRVTIIGLYMVREKNKNSLIYEKYIQVLGTVKRGRSFEDLEVSEEDEKKFTEMSKDPDLLKKMSKAVAPNIAGHDVEKSAMLLQMMGGNPEAGDRRGDIHILLIGDPGVGKSKLVRNIAEVAPLVVKASGAPTTTVGLTACVIKDETMPGGFILEAGAAVLADGGLLIVDEFDKMNKEARGAMHEIMEDQKTTISKANINTELNTRCSVLAIMNPKRNRFNKEEVVADQIDLPPTMLSRFDLIFAIRDIVNEKEDGEKFDAIFRARSGTEVETEYSRDDITKYIIYARSKFRKILLSEEAKEYLKKKFLAIRTTNKNGAIPITMRQADGMARLAEACAKLRLSETVNIEDAEKAMGIIKYYLDTMCWDPTTNAYDVDKTMGKETHSQQKLRESLSSFIEDNFDTLANKDGAIEVKHLEDEFKDKTKCSQDAFDKALGDLTDPKIGHFQFAGINLKFIEYIDKRKTKQEVL